MSKKLNIIGLEVNAITFDESMREVIAWGKARKPSYVCFANVHMTMEAYNDPNFQRQVNRADLVLTDGKPLTVACKWLHGQTQERIAGMDFMPALLEIAGQTGLRVFLFGSTPELLEALTKKIAQQYPATAIAGALSPPFRPLTKEEEAAYATQINQSDANIVFVSLGCPKQEKWMASNYQGINAVLLGVGGAFMTTAGKQQRSPKWMQKAGLEWLYRLGQEPRRLFKRYLTTNSKFVWLLLMSLMKKPNR